MSRSEIRPQVAAARSKVAAMQNVMNSHRRMRTTEIRCCATPKDYHFAIAIGPTPELDRCV
jgi:hypothetical protein